MGIDPAPTLPDDNASMLHSGEVLFFQVSSLCATCNDDSPMASRVLTRRALSSRLSIELCNDSQGLYRFNGRLLHSMKTAFDDSPQCPARKIEEPSSSGRLDNSLPGNGKRASSVAMPADARALAVVGQLSSWSVQPS